MISRHLVKLKSRVHFVRETIAANQAEMERLRAEIMRLQQALVQIKENYGQVCEDFELCAHAACRSSYGAWETANQALGDNVAQTGADYE